MEEIVQRDRELCQTKTFLMAGLILSGHVYDSLKLVEQRKILLRFIDKLAGEFFRRRPNQARAFENIVLEYKTGQKTKLAQNRKWNACFVVKQLRLLLVLHRQVEKAKEAAHGNAEQQQTLRSKSAPPSPSDCAPPRGKVDALLSPLPRPLCPPHSAS